MYTTKDGITFLAKEDSAPTSLDATGHLDIAYGGEYYTVYIDTNGNRKGPNALGKDLFYLIVDTKGTVIPSGGVAWGKYFNNNSISWSNGGCSSTKKAPNNALSCAGSIVDNGYKVIY